MITKKKVYVETSIVSYLTARPSSDLLAAAWQKITVDWWDTQRDRFDLFASEIVMEEAGRGSKEAAERRLEALSGIPLLAITEEVVCSRKCSSKKGLSREKPSAIPSILPWPLCTGSITSLPGITVILITLKQSQLSEGFVWKTTMDILRFAHLRN